MGVEWPFDDGEAVDASASDVTLAQTCRAFYVGATGNVQLTTDRGTSLTFNNVPAGTLLRVSANSFQAAGTTTADIVALY